MVAVEVFHLLKHCERRRYRVQRVHEGRHDGIADGLDDGPLLATVTS